MSQTFAQLINGKSATVEFSTGSASTPSVAFSGDTNTGIYSPGADQVAISTGGSGRLFINSSGNISLGASAASTFTALRSGSSGTFTLQHGSGADTRIVFTGDTNNAANNAVQIQAWTGSLYNELNLTGSYFSASTGGSERLRITSAGLVGIGSSAPQVALQLGNYSGNNQLAITSGSASGTGALFFGDGTGTDLYRGFIQYYHVNDSLGIGTAGNQQLTIDSLGRVGIGVGASTLLHLASADPVIRLQDTDTNGYGQITVDNGGSVYIQADEANTQASSSIRLNVDGSERARIDSSGRLLVGTSTPTVSRLFVSGGSLSVSGSDNDFAGGGNRVFIDHDSTNVRFGATGGGTTWTRGISLFTSSGSTTNTEVFNISSNGSFSAVTPSGGTRYPAFFCRAWVNFDGTGTIAIRDNGNVSSITDNGIGDYTVNFGSAMPDANYAVIASNKPNNNNTSQLDLNSPYSPATTSVSLKCSNSAGAAVDSVLNYVAIFR